MDQRTRVGSGKTNLQLVNARLLNPKTGKELIVNVAIDSCSTGCMHGMFPLVFWHDLPVWFGALRRGSCAQKILQFFNDSAGGVISCFSYSVVLWHTLSLLPGLIGERSCCLLFTRDACQQS